MATWSAVDVLGFYVWKGRASYLWREVGQPGTGKDLCCVSCWERVAFWGAQNPGSPMEVHKESLVNIPRLSTWCTEHFFCLCLKRE